MNRNFATACFALAALGACSAPPYGSEDDRGGASRDRQSKSSDEPRRESSSSATSPKGENDAQPASTTPAPAPAPTSPPVLDGGAATPTPTPAPGDRAEAMRCFDRCVGNRSPAAVFYIQCAVQQCGALPGACDDACFFDTCGGQEQLCDQTINLCERACPNGSPFR